MKKYCIFLNRKERHSAEFIELHNEVDLLLHETKSILDLAKETLQIDKE